MATQRVIDDSDDSDDMEIGDEIIVDPWPGSTGSFQAQFRDASPLRQSNHSPLGDYHQIACGNPDAHIFPEHPKESIHGASNSPIEPTPNGHNTKTRPLSHRTTSPTQPHAKRRKLSSDDPEILSQIRSTGHTQPGIALKNAIGDNASLGLPQSLSGNIAQPREGLTPESPSQFHGPSANGDIWHITSSPSSIGPESRDTARVVKTRHALKGNRGLAPEKCYEKGSPRLSQGYKPPIPSLATGLINPPVEQVTVQEDPSDSDVWEPGSRSKIRKGEDTCAKRRTRRSKEDGSFEMLGKPKKTLKIKKGKVRALEEPAITDLLSAKDGFAVDLTKSITSLTDSQKKQYEPINLHSSPSDRSKTPISSQGKLRSKKAKIEIFAESTRDAPDNELDFSISTPTEVTRKRVASSARGESRQKIVAASDKSYTNTKDDNDYINQSVNKEQSRAIDFEVVEDAEAGFEPSTKLKRKRGRPPKSDVKQGIRPSAKAGTEASKESEQEAKENCHKQNPKQAKTDTQVTSSPLCDKILQEIDQNAFPARQSNSPSPQKCREDEDKLPNQQSSRPLPNLTEASAAPSVSPTGFESCEKISKNAGKVPLRVGLSKAARIPSLLRIMKK